MLKAKPPPGRAAGTAGPCRETSRGIPELLSRSAEGMYAVDADQRILVWNASAERILGYRAQDVCGRFCYEVLRGRDEQCCRTCVKNCAAFAASIRQEPVAPSDVDVRDARGRNRWLNVSTIAVPPSRDDDIVLVHLFRDVDAQKRLQQAVNRALTGQTRQAGVGPASRRIDGAGGPRKSPSLRETEVLRMMAGGLSTAEIAEQLEVSRSTVRNHVQNVFRKLDVHSRLEAITYALQAGLL